MSKLSLANKYLREKKYDEAIQLYSSLHRENPKFSVYKFGLDYATRLQAIKLTRTAEAEEHTTTPLNNEVIHPSSKKEIISQVIFIVTPVLNGASFIDETIKSVVTQGGNFYIDYFIKDGSSTDDTLNILQRWATRIKSGAFPLRCQGLRFRYISTPDEGLYDAVAIGFSHSSIINSDKVIYTYINSDDVFTDNAFQIASHAFLSTKALWITGQTHVINEKGETISKPKLPIYYSRMDIANGLHDGRSLYFIQQEGCFWLKLLYDVSGGLTRHLKLAGDYDLWCKFAKHAELLTLDKTLASFRKHEVQLSNNIDLYYQEVDSLAHSLRSDATVKAPNGTLTLLSSEISTHYLKQNPGPLAHVADNNEIIELSYIKRNWRSW